MLGRAGGQTETGCAVCLLHADTIMGNRPVYYSLKKDGVPLRGILKKRHLVLLALRSRSQGGVRCSGSAGIDYGNSLIRP